MGGEYREEKKKGRMWVEEKSRAFLLLGVGGFRGKQETSFLWLVV